MLPGTNEFEGADWYDLEKTELSPWYACSLGGGGVVSAELMSSSWSSEEPEAAGDTED